LVSQFAAIGVIVSNLAASVAFYRRLGVPFAEDAISPEHGHVEAMLPGGIRFMLDSVEEVQKFDTEWAPPPGGHRNRIGIVFDCESPVAVDDLYAALIADGVQSYAEPWDAFWGERCAEVLDPDGNVVDLFAPLEGS
jgi:catechol 2,3-dioxygenase-like lactoylglutathione lyase family enzyme